MIDASNFEVESMAVERKRYEGQYSRDGGEKEKILTWLLNNNPEL